MRIEKSTCPECGEQLRGTIEIVHGVALIGINADGTAEYEGDTDMWWDEQIPVAGEATNTFRVICHNSHEWETRIDFEDEPPLKTADVTVNIRPEVTS